MEKVLKKNNKKKGRKEMRSKKKILKNVSHCLMIFMIVLIPTLLISSMIFWFLHPTLSMMEVFLAFWKSYSLALALSVSLFFIERYSRSK